MPNSNYTGRPGAFSYEYHRDMERFEKVVGSLLVAAIATGTEGTAFEGFYNKFDQPFQTPAYKKLDHQVTHLQTEDNSFVFRSLLSKTFTPDEILNGQSKIASNNSKISSLIAQEPHPALSPTAEALIVSGGGLLALIAAGTGFVYAANKLPVPKGWKKVS